MNGYQKCPKIKNFKKAFKMASKTVPIVGSFSANTAIFVNLYHPTTRFDQYSDVFKNEEKLKTW